MEPRKEGGGWCRWLVGWRSSRKEEGVWFCRQVEEDVYERGDIEAEGGKGIGEGVVL